MSFAAGRTKRRHRLLAERPRVADGVGTVSTQRAAVEREQLGHLAVLFEGDVELRELAARRLRRHRQRAGLSDHAIGLLDGDERDRFSA